MDKITPKYELAAETKIYLREQADSIVRGEVTLSTENLDAMPPAAVRALAHELQVHQIELEMQNETLRRTQLQLVEMQARYFDLYDLAPVSYCTVSETGIILEANLATAEMLGEARSSLVGQRISRYIRKEFQDTYYLCRKLLFSSGEKQSCELHMAKMDSSDFWVNIVITSAKGTKGDYLVRMVLTDITSTKVLALAMQESESRLRVIVEAQG